MMPRVSHAYRWPLLHSVRMGRRDLRQVRCWAVGAIVAQLAILGVMLLAGNVQMSSILSIYCKDKTETTTHETVLLAQLSDPTGDPLDIEWSFEYGQSLHPDPTVIPGGRNFEQDRKISLGLKGGKELGSAGIEWMDGIHQVHASELHGVGIKRLWRLHPGDWFLANYTIAAKFFKLDRKIDADAINEIDLQASVSNPNVVHFLGVIVNETETAVNGSSSPIGFLMEYFPGTQLEVILEETTVWKHPPINLSARVLIALQIARSLAYLHSQRIIHFDVKPSQILVVGSPKHPPIQAKLIDFGMAMRHNASSQYVDAQLEGGKRWRGTRHYMAPEFVFNDHNVTEKVDVYAFGVVLWEMYTRLYPYGTNTMDTVFKEIEAKTPLGLDIPSTCEPEWRELILDCMSWHPEDRPAFSEIANRLSRYLNAVNRGQAKSSKEWGAASTGSVKAGDYVEHEQKSTRRLLGDGVGDCGNVNWSDRGSLESTFKVSASELSIGEGDLGEGDYGTVYPANYTVEVQVKAFDEGTINSVQLHNRLRHPNIVHLLGVLVDDHQGKPYGVVTEHLGGDSATLQALRGSLSQSAQVQIASQLADALEYLHLHNVGLLNLSPPNILVAFNNVDNRPIIKIRDTSQLLCLREGNQIILKKKINTKAPYSAPELQEGNMVTNKTDVFALGGIMLEMCKGSDSVDCSAEWTRLAMECQREDPKERPDSGEVKWKLAQFAQ